MSEMRTALFFTEDDASRKNRKKKKPRDRDANRKERTEWQKSKQAKSRLK